MNIFIPQTSFTCPFVNLESALIQFINSLCTASWKRSKNKHKISVFYVADVFSCYFIMEWNVINSLVSFHFRDGCKNLFFEIYHWMKSQSPINRIPFVLSLPQDKPNLNLLVHGLNQALVDRPFSKMQNEAYKLIVSNIASFDELSIENFEKLKCVVGLLLNSKQVDFIRYACILLKHINTNKISETEINHWISLLKIQSFDKNSIFCQDLTHRVQATLNDLEHTRR